LKGIKANAEKLENSLRDVGLIKGHAQNLIKLQGDIDSKISSLLVEKNGGLSGNKSTVKS